MFFQISLLYSLKLDTMSINLCFFLVLFCLYYQGECAIKEILKKDFFTIYTHAAFETREIITGNVTEDQITYYLFTRKNPNNYTKIEPSDPDALNNTNVTIVFVIHGWTENRQRQWYEDLKNAFLTRQDEEFYVVQVDWSEPANQFYTISSFNTKDVGNYIGSFLVGLHRNYSIPLENFLVVGHSLGGQVAGYIGKKVIAETKEKLPRIVALDPAGPLFISRPDTDRLNPNDAKVVAVVHTNGGTFGFRSSCGTIDFYPNGGYLQPGCARIDLLDISSVAEPITCDHHRSWEFYIEAVLNPTTMVASRCSSWAKFKILQCDNKEEVTVGDLKTTLRGDFYFNTNRERPFARKATESYSESISDSISKLPIPGIEAASNAGKKTLSKLLRH